MSSGFGQEPAFGLALSALSLLKIQWPKAIVERTNSLFTGVPGNQGNGGNVGSRGTNTNSRPCESVPFVTFGPYTYRLGPADSLIQSLLNHLPELGSKNRDADIINPD